MIHVSTRIILKFGIIIILLFRRYFFAQRVRKIKFFANCFYALKDEVESEDGDDESERLARSWQEAEETDTSDEEVRGTAKREKERERD